MYRVNAFSKKGTKFRFRIQGADIHTVREALDIMFSEQEMRLVLVEPISA